jgi:hypothetical protein
MKVDALRFLLTFLLLQTGNSLFAQGDIPLATWRLHLSFNHINSIALGEKEVYAAAQNGVMIFYKDDSHVEIFNKMNGLSKTGITSIEYDINSTQLLVAYEDGSFDAIKDQTVVHIDPFSNTVIAGSKRINGITIRNSIAYFATDYGVLLFDLSLSQIKETWRDLGSSGSTLPIFETTFTSDSVFLATDKGVIAGKLTDNLLDFNKWKRFDTGIFDTSVRYIDYFNNYIYTSINGNGIYKYLNGQWIQLDALQGSVVTTLRASSNALFVSEGDNIWRMGNEEVFSKLEIELVSNALDVVEDGNGKTWVGDNLNGLISDNNGAYASIIPNGPTMDVGLDLTFGNGKMYFIHGGYSPSLLPLQNPGTYDLFENSLWTSVSVPANDLTSIAFSPLSSAFTGSFGYGVIQQENTTSVIWDESNSSLVNVNPPGRNVNITDLCYNTQGLWVLNYGATQSLHLFSTQDQWQSFSFPFPQAKYPLKLISDSNENIWQIINPNEGGGIVVYNTIDKDFNYLTALDNNGELPSSKVFSIREDRDGYVWVGTEEGVAYFYDRNSDAVKPIFENRFLLRDDKVKAIAVDGGNRKWMGTERGVWLFNPTGEELIENFNTSNSPLPSNNIIAIEVNPLNGEVFIATDKGLASYRSNATEADVSFENVKIFPNPVYREYSGLVGISGLATDAIVKITDVSGKLIYQTQANGGTASWNVQDVTGRRVNTGIFLVYAIAVDGSESVVGKIAIVN